MKKVFISLFGLILSIGAWAQCPTEGTDAYPVPVDSSLLTINAARRADCDAYIKGSCNPLYIPGVERRTTGTTLRHGISDCSRRATSRIPATISVLWAACCMMAAILPRGAATA